MCKIVVVGGLGLVAITEVTEVAVIDNMVFAFLL